MNCENRHPVHLTTTMDVFEDFKGYTEWARGKQIIGDVIMINADDFSYQDDAKLLSAVDAFMNLEE